MGYQEIPKELLEEMKKLTFVYLGNRHLRTHVGDFTYEVIIEFNFDKLVAIITYLKCNTIEYEIKGMKISEFKSEHMVTRATKELKEYNLKT